MALDVKKTGLLVDLIAFLDAAFLFLLMRFLHIISITVFDYVGSGTNQPSFLFSKIREGEKGQIEWGKLNRFFHSESNPTKQPNLTRLG